MKEKEPLSIYAVVSAVAMLALFGVAALAFQLHKRAKAYEAQIAEHERTIATYEGVLYPMARNYFRQSEGRTDFYDADLSKYGHVIGIMMMNENYALAVPWPYYDRRKDPAQAEAFDANGNLLPGH